MADQNDNIILIKHSRGRPVGFINKKPKLNQLGFVRNLTIERNKKTKK